MRSRKRCCKQISFAGDVGNRFGQPSFAEPILYIYGAGRMQYAPTVYPILLD